MSLFRHTLLVAGLCGTLAAASVFAEGAANTVQAPPAASPPAVSQNTTSPDGVAKPGQMPKPNANPMNLNPAQQKALATLRKEQVANMQKIHTMQVQLMEMSYADNYDKGKAGELVDQIVKATEENMASHSERANAFYVSLSPEQKKLFKAFELRRLKNMGGVRPAAGAATAPPAQKTP